jgi:hypothetical protein
MKLPVFDDPVTGEPSFSFTVAAVTFTIVLAKWLAGGLTILGYQMALVPESEIRTWLDPTLVFYTARAGTKAIEKVALAKLEKVP